MDGGVRMSTSQDAMRSMDTQRAHSEPGDTFDIVILGAGPVGTTLALLLAGSLHRVLLVEQRTLAAGLDDPRALALSEGARQLLAPHNAWPAATGIGDGRCTAIETIHISQSGGFGRTLIDRNDYRVPALGYVVRYGALIGELHQALQRAMNRHGDRLVCLEQTSAQVINTPPADHAAIATDTRFWRTVELACTPDDGNARQAVRTRLIVHAEGTPPDDSAGVITRGYGQRAIIFEAGLAQSHGQRAWERFTQQGPLALLPVDGTNGRRVSVVYTVPESAVDGLLALNDAEILQRIQQAIGPLVQFTDIGPRASFPLKLRLRQPMVQARELWIGNAAQTLHPVSGQGFNLGLRDAAQLAQALRQSLDPGSAPLLNRYARQRQLDRWGAAGFTDGIVRTFSTPFPALNAARGLALSALDVISPLRHFVARRMIWGARAWP